MNKIYVGIDVSKHFIDVAIQKQSKRFTNNKKGLQVMLQWLTQKHPEEFIHIIFEPTGGYEITLAKFLHNEEVLWSRPNPLRTRQYARALGVMAKTDKIDSFMIAKFGEQFSPKPQQLSSGNIIKQHSS